MKKTRGLILLLSPVMVGMLWLLVSVVFYLIATVSPTAISMLVVIKSLANRSLGILGMLSLIAMIVGIVFLSTQNDARITVKEAINYGWKNSKKHVKKFLLGFGIWLAVQFINGLLNSSDGASQTLVGMISTIVSNILSLWIMLGLTQISLDIVYERKSSPMRLFVDLKKTGKYIIAYIINIVIIFIGYILFIIPGIIRAFRLSLIQYLILEKNYGPLKAIKTSRRISKGFVTDMFAINLVGGLINILGLLALFVGMIRTVPLLLLANAYVYKKISEINKHMINK